MATCWEDLHNSICSWHSQWKQSPQVGNKAFMDTPHAGKPPFWYSPSLINFRLLHLQNGNGRDFKPGLFGRATRSSPTEVNHEVVWMEVARGVGVGKGHQTPRQDGRAGEGTRKDLLTPSGPRAGPGSGARSQYPAS